jgi:hypothetical protein
MNETLSTRQLRLVALLGLVVVVAGGYWLLVARPKTTTTPSTARSTPAHTTATPTAPRKGHTHATTPAKVAVNGLPFAVAKALRKHSVVVVSLYSPRAGLDKLASAEAKAGAAASRAGFVSLDVFRQSSGSPILRKVGVVDTPAVLVISRPHTVYAVLRGFADRLVVEQAVADARG